MSALFRFSHSSLTQFNSNNYTHLSKKKEKKEYKLNERKVKITQNIALICVQWKWMVVADRFVYKIREKKKIRS